jgi:hypothetical protein
MFLILKQGKIPIKFLSWTFAIMDLSLFPGASQSPMSINKATNINRMRLVYNPACEDSTDEILVAQQNSSGSADASHARVIDTKTYCKRDRCNV